VLGSELAMFVAADAKKLLKAFAILVLSVVGVPSEIISVILCVLLLRLAASLSISHFFLVLLAASNCS
jgi:predicted cation transporter